jgi:uncharacterized protein (TIGR00369 family)
MIWRQRVTWSMSKERFFTDGCFCCGRNNPRGLSIKLENTGDGAAVHTSLDKVFQSFPDVAHGGIASTLIDEALWYAFYFKGLITVTRKLDITFKKPVPLGVPICATGRVVKLKRGRIWEAEGRITDESGKILVLARGEFVEVDELKDKLLILSDKS